MNLTGARPSVRAERDEPHPRVEDAAYLRVIAFHRSLDKNATERAAGEYLKRFPSGFRRAEVKALTSSP